MAELKGKNFHPNGGLRRVSPLLPTGLEPFIGLFPVLQENGTSAKAVRVIEDGNFVVLHQLWTGAKPFDEASKIAEHWNVIRPIPSEGLANDNTMFGF